jgi:hypothetical protein
MAMGTSFVSLTLTHEEADYYRCAEELSRCGFCYGLFSPVGGGVSPPNRSRHCRATFGTDQICEYVAGRRKTVVMFDTISGSV